MNNVIILSENDINNLHDYKYLIKEAADANHLAIDKLIVLKCMASHGSEPVEKEVIVELVQSAIKLISIARLQNNLLIKYLEGLEP